jgi:hypothetical protein
MTARYSLLVTRQPNMFGIETLTAVIVLRSTDGGTTWEPYCQPATTDQDEGRRIVVALNTAADSDAVDQFRQEIEKGTL